MIPFYIIVYAFFVPTIYWNNLGTPHSKIYIYAIGQQQNKVVYSSKTK